MQRQVTEHVVFTLMKRIWKISINFTRVFFSKNAYEFWNLKVLKISTLFINTSINVWPRYFVRNFERFTFLDLAMDIKTESFILKEVIKHDQLQMDALKTKGRQFDNFGITGGTVRQLTVPPVMPKLSNWRPFVFSMPAPSPIISSFSMVAESAEPVDFLSPAVHGDPNRDKRSKLSLTAYGDFKVCGQQLGISCRDFVS